MNINTNKVFFSVAKGLNVEHDYKNHADTKQLLETIKAPFFETIGSYKGVEEMGFCLYTTNAKDFQRLIGMAKEIATKFKQESILTVHGDNHAELIFSDCKVQVLGQFKQVSKEYAMTQDAWTKAKNGTTYYVAE